MARQDAWTARELQETLEAVFEGMDHLVGTFQDYWGLYSVLFQMRSLVDRGGRITFKESGE